MRNLRHCRTALHYGIVTALVIGKCLISQVRTTKYNEIPWKLPGESLLPKTLFPEASDHGQ